MCISCPDPHYKPRHSIPRCKIRQKNREISHFPQFIMVSALKLLIELSQVCTPYAQKRQKLPAQGITLGYNGLKPYALKGQKLSLNTNF